MKAIILCQIGYGIGLGHLKRSLRVASAIEEKLGAFVEFFVIGPETKKIFLDERPAKFLDEGCSILERFRLNRPSIDLVIIDVSEKYLPAWITDVLKNATQSGAKIVAIDSLDLRPYVDLVFAPSFRIPRDIGGSDASASVAYGWDCFLLDGSPELVEWRSGSGVLVLTGGSDATNLGRCWPTLLDKLLPAGTQINWVTGPFSESPCWPNTPRLDIVEHKAPSNLIPLISSSNYAVTVYGVSFFELVQSGIPTVVFSPYGDKDRDELEEINRLGLAIIAKDEVEATEGLVDLMANPSLSRDLSSRGMERLRLPGVDRLCDEIKRLFLNRYPGEYKK